MTKPSWIYAPFARLSRKSASRVEAAAGNGLLDRRALLGRGIGYAGAAGAGVVAAATGAAAEPLKDDTWSGELGSGLTPLQTPSRFEKDAVRTRSNPDNLPGFGNARTPHHLLQGTITPNALHFSCNQAGVPEIDPARHKLVIHGMVKRPLLLDLETLARYPMVTRIGFLECAGNSASLFSNQPLQANAQGLHGLVSNAEWTGVPLSILLDEAGIDPSARWLVAEGADLLAHARSVPTKKAYDDAIIALYQNGERLMPGNGYPMRLFLPGYQGNMNVKYLRRIKAAAEPMMSHSDQGYSVLLPDGKAWRFNFLQEVKSFITHPSVGHTLKGPGYYDISGVAYSGTGRIQRVMVSADGGRSWAEAVLQTPVLPKAFTRFRLPWRWDGQPAVLTSRALDEAGNEQPLRAQFVAIRGQTKVPLTRPGVPSPHYNATTAWGIGTNGEISHVYA